MAVDLNEELKFLGFRQFDAALLLLGEFFAAAFTGTALFLDDDLMLPSVFIFFGFSTLWLSFLFWKRNKPKNYLRDWYKARQSPQYYGVQAEFKADFWRELEREEAK